MKKRSKIFIVVGLVFVVSLALLGYGYYVFQDVLFTGNKFRQGTTINGIDISGLNKEQAQNVVATKLTDARNEITINLHHENQTWTWTGKDFEIDNQIMPYVENVFNYFNEGNLIEKKVKLDKLNGNRAFNIPYGTILTGLDEKIATLAEEIDKPAVDATLNFDVTATNPLIFTEEQEGEIVEQEQLKNIINDKLLHSKVIDVDIPMIEVKPQILKIDLEKTITKRGSFSTNYAKSSEDRKHNVKHALESFNGMMIEPNQEISFNATTGSRTAENGYKKANIILNGVYVEGTGGGVCQASTTLYNALLNADLEILEVNKHTLPASYVWLAFDAMVSEGYSDLKFKNNTDANIYIKTYADDENVYVDIYGKPFPENETVQRRVEFLGAIPHPGDRIVPDTDGQYSNKVTYKGEYLRLKYPREGYKAKGYIDRYKDGVLVESTLIRDETYQAQEGIIIEGVEEVTEGITLPPNTVQFIPPQEESLVNEENVQKKIQKENPSNYNP